MVLGSLDSKTIQSNPEMKLEDEDGEGMTRLILVPLTPKNWLENQNLEDEGWNDTTNEKDLNC